MVATRLEITLISSWVIIRGLLARGVELYGPFNTLEEAQDYSGKNFPDDTREYIQMVKEVVTHGEG